MLLMILKKIVFIYIFAWPEEYLYQDLIYHQQRFPHSHWSEEKKQNHLNNESKPKEILAYNQWEA